MPPKHLLGVVKSAAATGLPGAELALTLFFTIKGTVSVCGGN